MVATNYAAALAFVWGPGRDAPSDGAHTTPGDPGGQTNGGVIHATWQACVEEGLVSGSLVRASTAQLSLVLRQRFWGATCDGLPAGLDVLVFNGRMMTGKFTALFQQCLGFYGPDNVDGNIGPISIAAAARASAPTLIDAVTGAHLAYLGALPSSEWREFGAGWTTRLIAAQAAAKALAISQDHAA